MHRAGKFLHVAEGDLVDILIVDHEAEPPAGRDVAQAIGRQFRKRSVCCASALSTLALAASEIFPMESDTGSAITSSIGCGRANYHHSGRFIVSQPRM